MLYVTLSTSSIQSLFFTNFLGMEVEYWLIIGSPLVVMDHENQSGGTKSMQTVTPLVILQ